MTQTQSFLQAIIVVVVVTVNVSTFDPFLECNSLVVIAVTISEEISATFSPEFVVSSHGANIGLERPKFSALQHLQQIQ